MSRPPPVRTDDDDSAPRRRDTDSDDVRRIYPDLPQEGDRNSFLSRCDHTAYDSIRLQFPKFHPPGRGSSTISFSDASS